MWCSMNTLHQPNARGEENQYFKSPITTRGYWCNQLQLAGKRTEIKP